MIRCRNIPAQRMLEEKKMTPTQEIMAKAIELALQYYAKQGVPQPNPDDLYLLAIRMRNWIASGKDPGGK